MKEYSYLTFYTCKHGEYSQYLWDSHLRKKHIGENDIRAHSLTKRMEVYRAVEGDDWNLIVRKSVGD